MPDEQCIAVCIIPAFNEGRTVAQIARLAATHPHIHRVVVVDDGSVDDTSECARSVDGVDVIRLEPNRGKGAAMHAGIEASHEPVILFLDADLINFKHEHISELLEPVLSGHADMTVGVFRGGRLHTDLAHIVAPSLSGQRAIKREILTDLDWDKVGFGIERALTELWEKKKIHVGKVVLHGVSHVTKEEKRGYLNGVKQRMEMYRDIMKFEANKMKKKKG
ncbi:MAG TPA: glycosyltransferase [Firmicutes bacterium]|nr:glycosyltransferase [Bacillota bacterium]